MDGKIFKCKYLLTYRNGKTSCRVYGSRLRKVIDVDSKRRPVVCMMRDEIRINYDGCPHNKDGNMSWDEVVEICLKNSEK